MMIMVTIGANRKATVNKITTFYTNSEQKSISEEAEA